MLWDAGRGSVVEPIHRHRSLTTGYWVLFAGSRRNRETAWLRLATFILPNMRFRWVFVVSGVMPSSLAISLLLFPSTRSFRMHVSRGLSSAALSVPRGAASPPARGRSVWPRLHARAAT